VPGAEADPERAPDDRCFLFLHLMKTGGTTLLAHLEENFPPGTMYPDPRTDPLATYDGLEYGSLDRLRTVGMARRDRVRAYAGHFPHLAVDIVRPDVTITLLREPVERAVSLLRQVQASEAAPGREPRSLEAIYEQDPSRWMLVQDYQVRQFALTADELAAQGALIDAHFPDAERPAADVAHFVYLALDDARLERAVAALESVEVVGLQSDFDGLLDQLWRRYRWRLPAWHRRRVASGAAPAPEALLRRVAQDNAYDVEFHARAVELVRRRSASAP
jgi:hypothetical protein